MQPADGILAHRRAASVVLAAETAAQAKVSTDFAHLAWTGLLEGDAMALTIASGIVLVLAGVLLAVARRVHRA